MSFGRGNLEGKAVVEEFYELRYFKKLLKVYKNLKSCFFNLKKILKINFLKKNF